MNGKSLGWLVGLVMAFTAPAQAALVIKPLSLERKSNICMSRVAQEPSLVKDRKAYLGKCLASFRKGPAPKLPTSPRT